MVRAAYRVFRSLPWRWRERLRALAPSWAHRLRSDRLADGGKRLDRVARPFVDLLTLGSVPGVQGRACLEFSCGNLMAEPLLYHLLGARRVVATDYTRLLDERLLGRVCRGVAEGSLLTHLGRLEDPAAIRRRWQALRDRTDWTLRGLADLGIEYVAPYDAAQGPLPERFDVITSVSVMEHVPREQAGLILGSLAAMLRPGGVMVHAIHLQDHRDMHRAPFAFLAADTDWTEAQTLGRGNRLRCSDWERLALSLPDVKIVAFQPWAPLPLPPRLHPDFARYDPADLAVRGVNVALRKIA